MLAFSLKASTRKQKGGKVQQHTAYQLFTHYNRKNFFLPSSGHYAVNLGCNVVCTGFSKRE